MDGNAQMPSKSNIPPNDRLVWREPRIAERKVAEQWIAAWNDHTGDSASLPEGWEAADACGCGTCPTFTMRPITLARSEDEGEVLEMGSATLATDGTAVALVISFGRGKTVELEFAPYENRPLRLEDVIVDFGFRR